MLRRDLDWIVLKAVARDRAQRYGSVGELAADLRRLLDDQPVTAAPPARLYRASKFVRRHRAAVGALALALAIKEKVLGPEHFFVAQSLSNLSNVYMESGRYDQAESLHRRALRIKRGGPEPDHPEIGVSEHNLGDLALRRGDLTTAEAQYRRGREIWARTLPPDHPFLAFSDQGLANVYRDLGQAGPSRAAIERPGPAGRSVLA